MTRFSAKRLVCEGGRIPRGWAIAYRDLDRDAAVAYPVPLHFVVRWARDLWFWLMVTGYPGRRERYLRDAYLKGREDGERLVGRYVEALKIDAQRQYELGYAAAIAALEALTKQR